MKNTFIIIAIFSLASFASAQVAIGKENINGTSTLLDFDDASTNFKGIILPALDATPTLTSVNNGTFLFDKSDNKIKMYENGIWVALSDAGDSTQIETNNSVESASNQGVIIGATSSSAIGVLVLESEDKALILPKISNAHTTVKNPYPGMICYDTVSKKLAIFDGNFWNYWK